MNDNHPLPTGLPADLTAFLQQSVRLPSWADPAKLQLAQAFNRRNDTYMFFLYGLGSKLKQWRIRMSAAEEVAWLHSWQVAISLLGVRDEYIPATLWCARWRWRSSPKAARRPPSPSRSPT